MSAAVAILDLSVYDARPFGDRPWRRAWSSERIHQSRHVDIATCLEEAVVIADEWSSAIALEEHEVAWIRLWAFGAGAWWMKLAYRRDP